MILMNQGDSSYICGVHMIPFGVVVMINMACFLIFDSETTILGSGNKCIIGEYYLLEHISCEFLFIMKIHYVGKCFALFGSYFLMLFRSFMSYICVNQVLTIPFSVESSVQVQVQVLV